MVPMRTVSAGLTHVGQKRTHNEDFFLCDDKLGLYVVADGVGGHAKGEVASREAVEEVAMWVKRHLKELDRRLEAATDDDLAAVRRLLESGVQSACYMVYGLAEQDPEKHGMSTTMSVLLVRGGRAVVAQVGDSRVYRVRGAELMQVTEDHTLVNYRVKQGLMTADEAKVSPTRNVITRAVGHRDYVEVDTFVSEAEAGDRYFLCTDGFHGYLPAEQEVRGIMTAPTMEKAVRRAVDLANDLGGRDNVTAVLVRVL
jgi:protein phosphatase